MLFSDVECCDFSGGWVEDDCSYCFVFYEGYVSYVMLEVVGECGDVVVVV